MGLRSRYEYEAYEQVQNNLRRLIEQGPLRPATDLSLALMADRVGFICDQELRMLR